MMIEKDKLEKIYALIKEKLSDEERKTINEYEMKITIFLCNLDPSEILILNTIYSNYF